MLCWLRWRQRILNRHLRFHQGLQRSSCASCAAVWHDVRRRRGAAVGKLGRRDKGGNEGAEAAPPATITFEAPCHVYWTRCAPVAPDSPPPSPPPRLLLVRGTPAEILRSLESIRAG